MSGFFFFYSVAGQRDLNLSHLFWQVVDLQSSSLILGTPLGICHPTSSRPENLKHRICSDCSLQFSLLGLQEIQTVSNATLGDATLVF